MNRIDPSSIIVALEVARRGSLSAACDALGLSQPTVGRHVRALEDAIGAPLFVRHARGMRPAQWASNLFEAAGTLEDALFAFERAARGAGGGQGGGGGRATTKELEPRAPKPQ